MGADYYISQYVGFKINRDWNDNTAELIRQNVINNILTTIGYCDKYLIFTEQEINIELGRLNQFTIRDRITNEVINPKEYIKDLTREQFKKDIKFNVEETEFLDKIKELELNFELKYFEIAQILY